MVIARPSGDRRGAQFLAQPSSRLNVDGAPDGINDDTVDVARTLDAHLLHDHIGHTAFGVATERFAVPARATPLGDQSVTTLSDHRRLARKIPRVSVRDEHRPG